MVIIFLLVYAMVSNFLVKSLRFLVRLVLSNLLLLILTVIIIIYDIINDQNSVVIGLLILQRLIARLGLVVKVNIII